MPPVRIAIDGLASDPVGPEARFYAAEELLRPLGLRAVRSEPGALEAGDLYVGVSPEAVPEGAIRLQSGAPAEAGLEGGVLGDLVAETFRQLAGIVETSVRQRDRLGRFLYAFHPETPDPLGRPVDAMRARLADALRQRGVPVRDPEWDGKRWAVAVTHDLDALRTRRLASLVGDGLRGHLRRGLLRATGPDDRMRTARALAALSDANGTPATFFAKAGASGREDVPTRPERHAGWFRQLREAGHEVGLHPSIQAATDPARLARERDRLAAVLGERPTLVRSHFLRWTEPMTPEVYADAGFRADSTLGWADRSGFRRGTAHPFRLWDHRRNAPSRLWELPLAAMDTTLFVHRGVGDDEAADTLRRVLESARQSGGLAVLLWHNCMDGDPAWWRRLRVLESVLAVARDRGAAVLPLGRALALAQSRI